jgi:hypothetical protein
LRNGVHVAPRDLFGIPIQIVAILATRALPMKVNDGLFPAILDMALGYPAGYGIKRPKANRKEGRYAEGEDAMDKAERALPIPEHAANDLSTNAGVTVEQLRGQLDRIMKAEG